MKMAVFWVAALCSLVEVYRVLIAMIVEAACISETSVNFYQITWYYNPEDSHLLMISDCHNHRVLQGHHAHG
jgi:hypothetical protein